MRCEEFESRLNEILDRRRNPRSDAELSLHANSCPECGDLLAGYQTLLAGFKRRPVVAPTESIAAGVRYELGQNRSRGMWRQRAPLALVAAALVTVAILPGIWSTMGRTPVGAPETSTLATTASAMQSPDATSSSGAPLSVLARMAGDQFRFLAVHSEQSAALAWKLVPSVEDVIEGIEGGRRGPGGRLGLPGPNKSDKPHNPSAVSALPSASG